MKTLPTSTSPLLVRIIENKLTAELTFYVIHLCAHKCHEGFAVNDYFVVIFFDYFIKFICILNIVHCIGETIATLFSQTYPDTNL